MSANTVRVVVKVLSIENGFPRFSNEFDVTKSVSQAITQNDADELARRAANFAIGYYRDVMVEQNESESA